MVNISLTIFYLHLFNSNSDIEMLSVPVHQFKWLIILSALALHGVIAVILAELMGRSYGNSMLWFAIAFFLPFVGPISIWLYHLALSNYAVDARKKTFWDRVMFGGPVSLSRILLKEQAMAQEVTLHNYKTNVHVQKVSDKDPDIDAMIEQGDFSGARAHAWQIMGVAQDAGDKDTIARYQRYLEIIAEEEALSEGVESTIND